MESDKNEIDLNVLNSIDVNSLSKNLKDQNEINFVDINGNIEDEAHIPIGSIDSASLYGIPQEFGCFTKLRGLFQKQLADGIIGLAPRGKFCE